MMKKHRLDPTKVLANPFTDLHEQIVWCRLRYANEKAGIVIGSDLLKGPLPKRNKRYSLKLIQQIAGCKCKEE